MVDLAKLAKGIATSRTMYGGVSLFGMVVGNVRIQGNLWVFDYTIPLNDVARGIAAAVGLAFVVWGRLKASGPLITDKPTQPAEMAEARGFPRV